MRTEKMKKILTFLSLSASILALAGNLLQNPDFSMEKGYLKDWSASRSSYQTSDNILHVTLQKGQRLHVYGKTIVLDQKERGPIHFGIEYQGTCASDNWEHCIVLADLTYQDGTKENWSKVLINVPSAADDWKKLDKTAKLPKPVKSFRFLILLKDETTAKFRNPYVRVDEKKNTMTGNP